MTTTRDRFRYLAGVALGLAAACASEAPAATTPPRGGEATGAETPPGDGPTSPAADPATPPELVLPADLRERCRLALDELDADRPDRAEAALATLLGELGDPLELRDTLSSMSADEREVAALCLFAEGRLHERGGNGHLALQRYAQSLELAPGDPARAAVDAMLERGRRALLGPWPDADALTGAVAAAICEGLLPIEGREGWAWSYFAAHRGRCEQERVTPEGQAPRGAAARIARIQLSGAHWDVHLVLVLQGPDPDPPRAFVLASAFAGGAGAQSAEVVVERFEWIDLVPSSSGRELLAIVQRRYHDDDMGDCRRRGAIGRSLVLCEGSTCASVPLEDVTYEEVYACDAPERSRATYRGFATTHRFEPGGIRLRRTAPAPGARTEWRWPDGYRGHLPWPRLFGDERLTPTELTLRSE